MSGTASSDTLDIDKLNAFPYTRLDALYVSMLHGQVCGDIFSYRRACRSYIAARIDEQKQTGCLQWAFWVECGEI